MGLPRIIVLIRHAESEGNVDRRIHQNVPDHKVPLTPKGRDQAFEAGKRLAGLLNPKDSVQLYVSPYRRTRETSKHILEGMDPNTRTRVYEDSRLREQDWGNFQADDQEMSRIRRERAAYGHLIPHGESAADVWDRMSGFCETLFRAFKDPEFPSVLVIVSHGLALRIFVCRWYHWSVEKFETLANIPHTGFIIMEHNDQSGKYILKTKMKTWAFIQDGNDSDDTGSQATKCRTAAESAKRIVVASTSPDLRQETLCNIRSDTLLPPDELIIPPHRPHSPLPSPGVDFYYDSGDNLISNGGEMRQFQSQCQCEVHYCTKIS